MYREILTVHPCSPSAFPPRRRRDEALPTTTSAQFWCCLCDRFMSLPCASVARTNLE